MPAFPCLVNGFVRQMNGLGENVVSPFQRLSQYLSTSVTGGLDSLNSGARGAMEGAQTQLDQSFSEKIGHPIEVLRSKMLRDALFRKAIARYLWRLHLLDYTPLPRRGLSCYRAKLAKTMWLPLNLPNFM